MSDFSLILNNVLPNARAVGRGIAKVVQTKFDARTLHEQPAVAAESRMVDDGKGAKEVFRVDNFDLLQVAEEDHGRFYSGDSYVVLYAYNNGARDEYLIYYWLVRRHFFPKLIFNL